MTEAYMPDSANLPESEAERRFLEAHERILQRSKRHARVTNAAHNILSTFGIAVQGELWRTIWVPFVQDPHDLERAQVGWRRLEVEQDGQANYAAMHFRETPERPRWLDAEDDLGGEITTRFGVRATFDDDGVSVSEPRVVTDKGSKSPASEERLKRHAVELEVMRLHLVEAEFVIPLSR